MNTCQNRFTRMFVMLLALAMIAGAFSGCQKNDPEPSAAEFEFLVMETTEPPATEETEPETSLPAVTTESTVSTEPSTEPTEADDTSTEPTTDKKRDKPHIHDYTKSVVAPTTSAKGYTLHTCKTCGDSYKDNYKDKLTSGNSGSSETHTHSYTTSVIQPTCTRTGYTICTCKTCGYSYRAKEKAALGHAWGEEEVYQAATPDGKQPALNKHTCDRCGEVEYIDKGLAHLPNNLIETVKPTCTEEGYELRNCLTYWCDYIHKVNIVPALGHDWSDWVVTTLPTQDKEGVETRTCSRCDEKETRKVDQLPDEHIHKYEATETVPATCDTVGKKTYTCTCGDSYDEDIPATGHAWGDWVRTQEPTEESEGVDTHTCSKCGAAETRKVDQLPAEHTHKYEVTDTVPATCTDEGKNTYTCACGDSYKEDIPTTGHAWGDWVRTQEPTEESEGVDTRTCSKCGTAETRPVEKLSNGHTHKYEVTETVPATCATVGKNIYACSTCGDSYEEEIPLTEHNWTDWMVIHEPTPDFEGNEGRTCRECYATEDRPLAKLPPTYEIDTSSSVIVTNDVIAVINKYRELEGRAPLSAGGGEVKENCTKIRAAELNLDFSHNRPDGRPASEFYGRCGFGTECIAGETWDAQSTVDAWMASEGHRHAIMNSWYTYATVARNGENWVILLG